MPKLVCMGVTDQMENLRTGKSLKPQVKLRDTAAVELGILVLSVGNNRRGQQRQRGSVFMENPTPTTNGTNAMGLQSYRKIHHR
jgi:hypothetical protein